MQNQFLDQERSNILQIKVNASSAKEELVAWPRAERQLPVVDLEIEWVRFSTFNHRIRAEQRQRVHVTGQEGLFSDDPLGDTAQQEIYEILKNQDGFKDFKADIKIRKQQFAGVVTSEGVLINGNRRAAALRSLYVEDHHLDSQYIRCMVLPADATPSEFMRLETELQIARDFKEEYSWINHALLIEDLYEQNGRDFNRVAGMMHMRAPDIERDYEKIQQVNQLVEMSGGTQQHISFEGNESAFTELFTHIRNKPNSERESVRDAYFLGTLTNVNYRELRHLRRPDATAFVTNEIVNDTELAPLIEMIQSESGNGSNDPLLGGVLGQEPETNIVRQVLEFVVTHDPDQPVVLPDGENIEIESVRDLISNAVEKAATEAKEQTRDVNALQAPINRLRTARNEIERVQTSLGDARAMAGWNEDTFLELLTSVEERLREIRNNP